MIENQRKRVEKAITDMINDMYKTHLRKMQTEMHLCAASCCDDQKRRPSIDNVQSCIEDCAGPLVRAQDYIQHELTQFQTRLQTCVMQCNDDAVLLNTHESDVSKHRYQFEKCTLQCVDKHIGLIPNMMRAIKTVLTNGPNPMKEAGIFEQT